MRQLGEGNVKSIHTAKLVFAFRFACNPVNVVASVRNAGIVSCLGIPVYHIDREQCRSLLYLSEAPTAAAAIETERGGRGLSDEMGDTKEMSVSIGFGILDDEVAELLEGDEE
jgi:hypothetical protein